MTLSRAASDIMVLLFHLVAVGPQVSLVKKKKMPSVLWALGLSNIVSGY